MTGIFRANNPLNASILFLYGLLLKIHYLFEQPHLSRSPSEGFLFGDFAGVLEPVIQWWLPLGGIIAYLLLFIQAATLNYYVNSHHMMAKPNYLCGMSYLLITSFFPEWNVLSVTLIVNTIMIWIIGKLFILDNTSKVKGTLFNLGFVIGFCSFLYFPSVFVLFVTLLSLIIMRSVKVDEWLMIFLGFITIWYFFLAWLFLTGKLSDVRFPELNFRLPDVHTGNTAIIWIGAILFLTIAGIYYMRAEMVKQIIQVRKRWRIILAGTLILLAIPFLNASRDLTDWLTAIYFLSPLVGLFFFYLNSKWIRLIIHWSMVGLVIYFQYF